MTTALGDVEDLVLQETRDRLEAAITFLKGSKAAALTAAGPRSRNPSPC